MIKNELKIKAFKPNSILFLKFIIYFKFYVNLNSEQFRNFSLKA